MNVNKIIDIYKTYHPTFNNSIYMLFNIIYRFSSRKVYTMAIKVL